MQFVIKSLSWSGGRRVPSIAAAVCALALVAAGAGAAETPADWTIAVYLDGDNDLEYFAVLDLAELASVGSTERIRVVVLADMLGQFNTRRGEVIKGSFEEAWAALDVVPEADMGSPATLGDFVRYARASFPANRHAVILWDHGNGWLPPDADTSAVADARRKSTPMRAVCHDATQGTILSIADVRTAMLSAAAPADILGFDACLMGMLEVAYELAPCAAVMVASEKTIPAPGWAYELVLAGIAASVDLSANAVATVMVDAYGRRYLGDEPLAAIDLAAAAGLVPAFDACLDSVLDTGGAEALAHVADACIAGASFDRLGYWDLGGLLEDLAARAPQAPWGVSAQAALSAYRSAVIARAEEVWPPATGLTIYAPPPGYTPLAEYNADTLRFAADTRWPEVLAALAALPLADDAFAPNATRATAKEISPGVEYRLRLYAEDDYFWFKASAGGRFTAVLRSFPEYADLDLVLLNSIGMEIAYSASVSGAEVVTWSGAAGASYYLHVELYDGPPSPYTLQIHENVDSTEYTVAEGADAFVPAAGGAVLAIMGDDGGASVELPFPFTFFGAAYDGVNVSTNGFLSFGRGVSAYECMPLPMPGPPTGIVAVCWSDLRPAAATRIVASVLGDAPRRSLTFTWSDISMWGYSDQETITFQASLYEGTNAMVFRYGDTVFDPSWQSFADHGGRASVGIQGEGAASAVLYSFNEPTLSDGLSVTFTPAAGVFSRGDANRNGRMDLSDAIAILLQLFRSAPIGCADASDGNDDGQLTIADPIRVLGRLFSGDAPLPPPYPGRGTDPTDDALGCGDA